MRIILCGGGTAGHINPAIAVAEEILDGEPASEILFIGRDGGGENELVRRAGISLQTIPIRGLVRSLSTENLTRIREALRARHQAERIIKEFKPDVILGTGGYVCWPVISAGRALGIPVAIHESNITPGLTTKLLARGCDAVFLGHEGTKKYLNKKARTFVVGTPLRKEFTKLTRGECRKKLGLKENDVLLISFGGSIGADKINRAMIEVMKSYSTKDDRITHIHATGERYYKSLPNEDKNYDKNKCKITAYIDNMPTLMRAADIAVCRSGAMTITELCAAGVTPILIPSPNVTANHQYTNARLLADQDAAEIMEEKNLTAKGLTEAINRLKIDKNGRKNKAKKLRRLYDPRAAKNIVKRLKLLINGTF